MAGRWSMTESRNTGSISARPNPIISSAGIGRVELTWTSSSAIDLEVRVGAPDGPLLLQAGSGGHTSTGPWVTDGTAFFLQDVSDGRPLSPEGTLDSAVVRVIPPRNGTLDKVCEFAIYEAQRFGCTHIVLVQPTDRDAASLLSRHFPLVGVGPRGLRDGGDYVSWIEADLETSATIALPDDLLPEALILYADATGPLLEHRPLLDHLSAWLSRAPIGIVATPVGTDFLTESAPLPPGAPPPFETLLRTHGLNVAFVGSSGTTPADHAMAIAVVERGPRPLPSVTPASFRVVAIMTAYNEEDIIVPAIARLLDQHIAVHLVDNWSTDATHQLARKFSGHELFTMERFPKDGPATTYQWHALLQRVEDISRETTADWFIHHDVDEVRISPWPGLNLRDAIHRVDTSGFNCIDHTVLEFHPVDDFFPFGGDVEAYFPWFDFGRRDDHFLQIKAWKNTDLPLVLAASGGHEVHASGRPYPHKFLLKHYPIRSQAHGERKVFRDRKTRWDPAERAKGWHAHYDVIREGHRFLRDPHTLKRFEDDRFGTRFLIERLSGVGVRRGIGASAERPLG
jgi:glycosyltransferase involved in cell wall biosynthesis